jgi:hypothetical protein
VAATDVPDNDILAHALMKVSCADKKEGWAVRCSGDFVNEYPCRDAGPKRTFSFFNNWCPAILQCLHANLDIKLLTNSLHTKDLVWYITNYLTKKQHTSTNISALLAKTYVNHCAQTKLSPDLKGINKKLIQQCGNTLSCKQELSAPEVISYLMGWGDRYISHPFETIQWYPLLKLIKKAYSFLDDNKFVPTLLHMHRNEAEKRNHRSQQ